MPKKLILTAWIWGVIMAVAIPPFQVMDEQRHYVRAGAMAEGNWHCDEGRVEISKRKLGLIEYSEMERITFRRNEKWDWRKTWTYSEPDDGSEKQKVWSNACLLPGIGYGMAAIGIWVGDRTGNQMAGLMLGRIANLTMAVGLIGAAIRLARINREVIAWIMMLPTTIFLLASISYDAVVIPLSLVTMVMGQIRGVREKIRDYKLAAATGLVAGVVTALKPVYAPVLAAGALLPWIGGSRRTTRLAITVLVAMGLVVVWRGVELSDRVMNLPTEDKAYFLETDARVREISGFIFDSKHRLNDLVYRPWDFGLMMLHTLRVVGTGYAGSMVGILGWGNTGVPMELMVWCLVGGLACVVAGEGRGGLGRRQKLMIGGALGVTVILLFAVFYVVETPIGFPFVNGVQGRYFLPLVYPASLIFGGRRKLRLPGWWSTAAAGYLAVVIVGTLASVWVRYYAG